MFVVACGLLSLCAVGCWWLVAVIVYHVLFVVRCGSLALGCSLLLFVVVC